MSKAFDNRLRPIMEFLPGAVYLCGAALLFTIPVSVFPLWPELAQVTAMGFTVLGCWRFRQGWSVYRYQCHLRQLPKYVLDADEIPLSRYKLFLGRGFRWDQRHTQRLVEARNPRAQRFLDQSWLYHLVRRLEIRWEHSLLLGWFTQLTRSPAWWNPLRPLPALGGNKALHGVGTEDESDIWMEIGERVGHTT